MMTDTDLSGGLLGAIERRWSRLGFALTTGEGVCDLGEAYREAAAAGLEDVGSLLSEVRRLRSAIRTHEVKQRRTSLATLADLELYAAVEGSET